MAWSDRDGTSTFEYVANATGYSGLRKRIYDRPNLRIEQLSVRTSRMDNVVPAETQVSFIKIDVEGGEYHVMLGGLETIKRSRPVIVFEAGPESTSCYDVTPEAMFELVVGRCGLRLSTLGRWLENLPPYSAKEFCESFEKGSDYYFIAYP